MSETARQDRALSAARSINVTPQSAGWTHVGFDVPSSQAGESARGSTGDREVCLVLISGKAQISAGGQYFGVLGERMTPFEGKPWSVYVPGGSDWMVTAATDVELAVCSAPGDRRQAAGAAHRAARTAPGDARQGHQRAPRDQHPAGMGAGRLLLVVEVITPGGHTSSYPPHKHDHRQPAGASRCSKRSITTASTRRRASPSSASTPTTARSTRRWWSRTARDAGAAAAITRCAAIHGYDLYYLNVMAGPQRTWKFHNAAEHEWLMKR